jgi:hypothetical protein
LQTGKVAVELAHREPRHRVVAFVAGNVEPVHHGREACLVRGRHLAHAVSDVGAIPAVVGPSGLDEHRQADVEGVRDEGVRDVDERLLFRRERRVPVSRVVEKDHDVRARRLDRRIGEEDVRVVAHRVDELTERAAGSAKRARAGKGSKEVA